MKSYALVVRGITAIQIRIARLGVMTCLAIGIPTASADDPFRAQVAPFVKSFCVECHNATAKEADLDLARYESPESAADDFRQWEHVITFVSREEMPPKSAKIQPTAEQRREFLLTVRSVLDAEAKKLAGDPGVVLPRRLSNAEYDHAIRDLTGVDIRPTRTFPVDPAAGEGFDNTGEALTMSPGLFAKIYSAAQHVADHALLTTTGLDFAPYPVATFADQAKYCEQAILRFYEQHVVDYESYLTACWDYRHRGESEKTATIEDWTRTRKLSPKYLKSLNELLYADSAKALGSASDRTLVADLFYVGWLRRRWSEIQDLNDVSTAKNAIQQLAREIASLSRQIAKKETDAIISNAGNAPIDHLERRRKTAIERDAFEPKSLQASKRLSHEFKQLDRQQSVKILIAATSVGAVVSGDAAASDDGFVIVKGLTFSALPLDKYKPDDKGNLLLKKLMGDHAPDQLGRLKFGSHPSGEAIDAESVVVSTTSPLEIELPVKAFGDLKEIRFYVDAELDQAHTKSGVLTISLIGTSIPAEGSATGNNAHVLLPSAKSPLAPTFLVDARHPIADEIAKSGAAFCAVFPNRFYYVDDPRGLSAGFHLIEGFFRDDQSLCKLVLSDSENRELDRLWTELEFITGITEKMLRGFVFFERSERNFLKHADFDPFKEEDPKLVETDTLNRFERVFLDRSNVKQPIEELTSHPIHIFFEGVRNGLRRRSEQLATAEPIYLRDIEAFARSAYRRSLSAAELEDLRSFFRAIAAQKDLGLEQAVRASLVRVLMSPYFGCRIVPTADGDTVQPLSDLELASRLSFFLWSSTPDNELLTLAEAGKLNDDATLLAQTRRMVKDAKVRDFAQEFFGQWLGYRDFAQRESVDRAVFREFDDSLKLSMFEEPTRLAEHLIRNDLPVTQLLDSDMTFVDRRLAQHYGVPFSRTDDEWCAVDGLSKQGRGGVMGMAVFLTANSQPQRTSPVKRGFWVVHKILGEHIPAPPADVVALPAKETDTNGKTIRELLALHVDDHKCARCHVRFDAIGLSMEGFDPIGRRRTKDLAGRPVDDVVRLSDGSEARGVSDFSKQLLRNRRDDYIRTLSRKMLGYALGRSLQLSDEVLLSEIKVTLDKHGDRFVPLIETIVCSPQFRNQRCRDFSVDRYRMQNKFLPKP